MDLHLDVDGTPGRTLRARTEHALREAVRGGRLAPGTRLPATRALATQLGVSRGVVVDAYAQLAAEGDLETARGRAAPRGCRGSPGGGAGRRPPPAGAPPGPPRRPPTFPDRRAPRCATTSS